MHETGSRKMIFGHHERVEAVMKPPEISAVSQGSFMTARLQCGLTKPPPLRKWTLRRLSGVNTPASPSCVVGGM